MPIIAKIEQQKKNQNRYNIYLEQDGQVSFAFGVSEDTFIRFNLSRGMVLTEEEIAKLQHDDQVSKALQAAIHYLSFRMRSMKEVHDHLREKEYDSNTIEAVLKQLLDFGYLDDLKFAQAYVRNEMNLSGKGPVVIKSELTKRGISPLLQEEAMQEYPQATQQTNAMKLAEKTLAKQKHSSKTAIQKTLQTLMRKGFTLEIARKAIQAVNVVDDSDEWRNLCTEGYKLHRKYRTVEGYEYNQKMKTALFRKGYPMDQITKFVESGKEIIELQQVEE